MLRTSLALLLAVSLSWPIWGGSSYANGTRPSKEMMLVLQRAKSGDFPKVLDAVDMLDKRGRKADMELVALLDYYIGEGPSTLIGEAITRRGKRMLDALAQWRNSDLQCIADFASICMSKFAGGQQLRDSLIDQLAEAIRKGKVLRSEQ